MHDRPAQGGIFRRRDQRGWKILFPDPIANGGIEVNPQTFPERSGGWKSYPEIKVRRHEFHIILVLGLGSGWKVPEPPRNINKEPK